MDDPVMVGVSIGTLSFSESVFEDESVLLFTANRIRLFIFDLDSFVLSTSIRFLWETNLHPQPRNSMGTAI